MKALILAALVEAECKDARKHRPIATEQGEPIAYGSLPEPLAATDLFKKDPPEAFMWCRLEVEHEDDSDAKDSAEAVNGETMETASADVLTALRFQVQRTEVKHVTTSMRSVRIF